MQLQLKSGTNVANGRHLDKRDGAPRSWLLLVVPLLILMLGFLIGPRVPDNRQSEFCVVNVRIGGPLGISLNCDSPEFMRLAQQPSALLEVGNTRQSRPGLIIAASALALPLSPLTHLTSHLRIRASRTDIEPMRVESALATELPAYAAYVSLNAFLLVVAFYIFQLVSGTPTAYSGHILAFASVCFLLAANDVVKAFVWSPHTQMFNILVPVFAVWASIRASEGALAERRYAFGVASVIGIGITAYPLFAVALPCILIAGATALLRDRSRERIRAFVVSSALVVALAALPEALWYLFVKYKTGGFYQHELAQGQVSWMFEAWSTGGTSYVVELWLRNFAGLLRLAVQQAGPLAGVTAVLIAVTAMNWPAASRAVRQRLPVIVCSVLVAVVICAFYSTTGLIVPRLAYGMIAALLPVPGAMLTAIAPYVSNGTRRAMFLLCVAIALVQSVLEVAKYGPYS